jgi:hypothetical protein
MRCHRPALCCTSRRLGARYAVPMPSSAPPSLVRAALGAGLLIGALDAVAATVHAWVFSGVGPDRVFRFVASGAFGKIAFTGGAHFIALGLLLHFLFAVAWTALFFFAIRVAVGSGPLRSAPRTVAIGAFWGLAVWLAMTLVVIPLSAIGPRPPLQPTYPVLTMVIIHLAVIGIPIALLARRHFTR